MRQFKDLLVWKKSRALTRKIYDLTKEFPTDERYGLVSQLRRAAVSIMTNIAEGARRPSPRDFAHFLSISDTSAAEVISLVITSADQGYISEHQAADAESDTDEISRMLFALRKRILADG